MREKALQICAGLNSVIVGKSNVVESVVCAIICGGHVLIEDVPGTGKTTLAHTAARLLGCSFQRIQFTPDVMPSDITGFTMIDSSGNAVFRPGLVFHQILLADEINRASPKTQSALLEAMQENQVTVDGRTYRCPEPFIVLATQNPSEHAGTFPLPEAQLDRFFMKITLGYPTIEEEMRILEMKNTNGKQPEPSAVATAEEVMEMRQSADSVFVSKPLREYISHIAAVTRSTPELRRGASTRAAIFLMTAAKGFAWLRGSDYAAPSDVQKAVPLVFSHRIVLSPEARLDGQTPEKVLQKVVFRAPVPRS